jgi:hypothetical protein
LIQIKPGARETLKPVKIRLASERVSEGVGHHRPSRFLPHFDPLAEGEAAAPYLVADRGAGAADRSGLRRPPAFRVE